MTLEDATIAGLDPNAFIALTQASDKGSALDANKVRDLMRMALDAGRLTLARADGAFTVSVGQARWGNVAARAEGAELAMTGSIDLLDATIDARLTLSDPAGIEESSVGRPDVSILLKGSVTAPERTLDVSALTGWLTLRAVDRQSKRLESLKAEPEQAMPVPASAPAKPDSELRPSAAPASPAQAPEPAPAASETPPPSAPARNAEVPAAGATEAAPPLPPPLEIAPLPGMRSAPSAPKKSSRKNGTNAIADFPAAGRVVPPADLTPLGPPPRRSFLDSLLGPLR
jgi:large subunit ribosomal protein L24